MIHYRTPAGRSLQSSSQMDAEDLIAHDAMMEELEAIPEVDEDDSYYEDPDADGYGWERHALRGAETYG